MDDTADTASNGLLDIALSALPMIATILVTIIVLWRVEKWFASKPRNINRPVTMLALTLLGVLATILAAPITDSTQGQLINLIGIAVTAVIALSSTTFVANMMAGLMLRSLRNFSAGDFIRVEKHFGRVTERGLFHTEIQTEDRDLTTIPNLLLATKPTTVVRASGTIVAATVSLGYDTPRDNIEKALISGAENAGLEDPFVQIRELGDYAVTYRIAGFLSDVKQLVSTKSRLRAKAMDALHEAKIEIVSPTYMNQRRADDTQAIPEQLTTPPATEDDATQSPEDAIFDKADAAEAIAEREKELEDLLKEIESLEKTVKEASGEEKESTKADLEKKKKRAKRLDEAIKLQKKRVENETRS